MLHSMIASYPHDVWEACEIDHPDHKQQLTLVAAKGENEPLFGRLAFVSKDRRRVSMREVSEESRPKQIIYQKGEESRPKQIIYQKGEECEALHERRLALLSKQSGWSVLDVEEVHDIF